jgi:hypothetical protein
MRPSTAIDLYKTGAAYAPLDTLECHDAVLAAWEADGLVYDSAFWTSGGRYEWHYRRLTP